MVTTSCFSLVPVRQGPSMVIRATENGLIVEVGVIVTADKPVGVLVDAGRKSAAQYAANKIKPTTKKAIIAPRIFLFIIVLLFILRD